MRRGKRIDKLIARIDEIGIDGILKQLTPREIRWIQAYLGEASFNPTKAEEIAGSSSGKKHNSDAATRWEGWRTYQRLEPIMLKLIENAGFNVLSVKCKLTEKMNAVRPEFFRGREVAKVEDHGVQLKAVELIGKALKVFDDRTSELDRDFEIVLAKIASIIQGKNAPKP